MYKYRIFKKDGTSEELIAESDHPNEYDDHFLYFLKCGIEIAQYCQHEWIYYEKTEIIANEPI